MISIGQTYNSFLLLSCRVKIPFFPPSLLFTLRTSFFFLFTSKELQHVFHQTVYHGVFTVLCTVLNTQIKHPTRCNNQSQNLLPFRTHTAQHVSGITMPIIRSPSNCRCSLWFPIIMKDSVFVKHQLIKHRSIVYKR